MANKPGSTTSADSPAPVPSPDPSPEQRAAHQSQIDRMRDHFRAQPKRRVKVRNDGDVTVQVNGYTFVIQANVPVDVPEQVADMLEAADYI